MKILVAMSGGVDSTVSAYRLKEEGHEIQGVYMKLHNDDDYHAENIRKVKKVAEYLGIDYHILDLREKFNEYVYNPFVKNYEIGLTPNPCVMCNRFVKFGALVDFAKSLGMDKLATGHYVRLEDGFITEATDMSKDQSYFLSNVAKENLEFVIFPLGQMYKEDIKKFAAGIDVLKEFSSQKESSEICFVPQTYVEVLQKHMDIDKPGNVLNTKGEVVGKHRGYMHYTIGKRKGFEVRGAHEPHYVIKIKPKENEIVVGLKDELDINSFEIKDINMFIDKKEFECSVKIRYRSAKTPCRVKVEGSCARVELKEPVQGLAAGQMAVFYDGQKVIGGGWIE
ncbi:MAG TPA: tRNA 2-thiouridine(34) synthase MnmA [Sulfurospirillum sp. UBA11407]|nr:MAG TPA: tRNA 2-thiouridine(34) synthase MnmA [Sulfurospirillum sp. UBA11407]DAB35056.1 MAG TPA: tRNA 2-thiouridine(34) synthase MnmA [Sulfurospirillum sp. UBA12182]